jgi:dolichol-phosphate mannosyltransferase
MVVDLTLYAIFQALFRDTSLKNSKVPLIGGSVDLALSGFLAVWLAMSWNFLINRRFTFNDARRNASIVRQYLTYATGNALAIGVSLVIRLWLPTQVEFFNNHKLAAALVGIVLATGISFSMARYFVFKSPGKS